MMDALTLRPAPRSSFVGVGSLAPMRPATTLTIALLLLLILVAGIVSLLRL